MVNFHSRTSGGGSSPLAAAFPFRLLSSVFACSTPGRCSPTFGTDFPLDAVFPFDLPLFILGGIVKERRALRIAIYVGFCGSGVLW